MRKHLKLPNLFRLIVIYVIFNYIIQQDAGTGKGYLKITPSKNGLPLLTGRTLTHHILLSLRCFLLYRSANFKQGGGEQLFFRFTAALFSFIHYNSKQNGGQLHFLLIHRRFVLIKNARTLLQVRA